LILASNSNLNFVKLKNVILITFKNRDAHPLLDTIYGINPSFQKTFSNLASQVELRFNKIEDVNNALNTLLSPIFSNKKFLKWNPKKLFGNNKY